MTALFPDRDRGAVLTDNGDFRFVLWRRLAPGARTLLFVMLNPSIADDVKNDPTIRRCEGFARREGFDELRVVNLFAYVSPEPSELAMVAELEGWSAAVHVDNYEHVVREAKAATAVVCAWGAEAGKPRLTGPARTVIDDLVAARSDLLCLGTTKDGHPRHPLYLRADTQLVVWPVRS